MHQRASEETAPACSAAQRHPYLSDGRAKDLLLNYFDHYPVHRMAAVMEPMCAAPPGSLGPEGSQGDEAALVPCRDCAFGVNATGAALTCALPAQCDAAPNGAAGCRRCVFNPQVPQQAAQRPLASRWSTGALD